jgi:signal transduction histidine kinase
MTGPRRRRPVRPESPDGAPLNPDTVAIVSHELRSPLTSLKGYANLLLRRWDDLEDADKRQMVAQMSHDGDRVARLITELLEVGRLEAGRLPLHGRLIDLGPLTHATVDRLRLQYPALTADVSVPDGFPAVWADPDRIEQVLGNLVENACRYGSPDGLRVELAAAPDEVTVSVTDRGPGIAADELPNLFVKGYRHPDARPAGTGLGLWISRGLIEAHGGRLLATSNVGQGATFRFTLPLTQPEQPPSP